MARLVSIAALVALAAAPAPPATPVVRSVDELLATAKPGEAGLVVLHFWATWCGACRAELPEVSDLSRRLSRLGVPLVGASLDPPAKAAAVAAFIREHALPFPTAILDSPDPAPVVARLDPDWQAQLPATFLLSRSGKTLRAYLGPTPVEQLLEDVRRLSQAPHHEKGSTP